MHQAQRRIRIAVVVASMAAQGIIFGKMMASAFKLEDQANYLLELCKRNEIALDEFDIIAMENLGIIVRKNED